MSLLVSTAFKTDVAAIVAAKFSGGIVRVFSGTRPRSVDQAEDQNGATLIGIVTNGGLPLGFAGCELQLWESGPYVVNDPAQNWILTPTASGTATWFRYVSDPHDDGGVNYSAYRMDANVGDGVGSELTLPDPALVFGAPVGPLSFIYTVPPIYP